MAGRMSREVVEEETHSRLGILKIALGFANYVEKESLTKGALIFVLSFIHSLIILYC